VPLDTRYAQCFALSQRELFARCVIRWLLNGEGVLGSWHTQPRMKHSAAHREEHSRVQPQEQVTNHSAISFPAA